MICENALYLEEMQCDWGNILCSIRVHFSLTFIKDIFQSFLGTKMREVKSQEEEKYFKD